MNRKVLIGAALLAGCLSLLVGASRAQEEKQGKASKEVASAPERQLPSAYRVEYAVRELEDGKRINSRSYKMLVQFEGWGRIRVGSRVPYVAGESSSGGKQIQYSDVGINVDCRVTQDRDNYVVLTTQFESSSLAGGRDLGGGVANPIFRSVRGDSTSVVSLAKATVIDVVDDVVTTHQYEIEVTVTKVK